MTRHPNHRKPPPPEWENWAKDWVYQYGDHENLGWLPTWDKEQDDELCGYDDEIEAWWDECDGRHDNAPERFVKLPRDYRS